jgi:hypothetical protein
LIFRLTKLALGLCLGLLGSFQCFGGDGGASTSTHGFALTGFGTVGLARSSSDTAEYVRDLSQPRGLTKNWSGKIDSVLGVQANLSLGKQTEGVVQVLSRYRYDGSFGPEISWAFLRHDFAPELQVRAGRLGTEFYMLADSRLVGYSNLTVRPPPDFFVPLIFTNFDGVDATANSKRPVSILTAVTQAGAGTLRATSSMRSEWPSPGRSMPCCTTSRTFSR